VLTDAQAQAVLAELDAATARAMASVKAREQGGAQGALAWLGISNADTLASVEGAVRNVQASVERLRSSVPDAVADDRRGALWLDAARSALAEVKSIAQDAVTASIDDVLASTASATAATVGKAASFTLSLLPWWLWVVGAVGIGGFVYLRVRK
jgi:hypothetical protein